MALALYGLNLDPDVVSERMGLQPTLARRRGDRSSARGRPANCGSWNFSVEAKPPTGPDDLVHQLLDHFPSDSEFWLALRREYQVQIRFGFVAATLTGCFEIESPAAQRLAATGATLAFHLYSYEA